MELQTIIQGLDQFSIMHIDIKILLVGHSTEPVHQGRPTSRPGGHFGDL